MKTLALIVLVASSTFGCSAEPAKKSEPAKKPSRGRATAPASTPAQRAAQADRIVADFKPSAHDDALRRLEAHVARRNWIDAQKEMDALSSKIPPVLQAGRVPDSEEARRFMARYYAAHKALVEVNTREAHDAARGADARRMAALPTAESIFAAYHANEIDADRFYKGKTFELVGTVTSIGKDILGTPYLALDAGPRTVGAVRALFPSSDEAQLASLTKGQRIFLRCTGHGKSVNVLLRDCSIRSGGS